MIIAVIPVSFKKLGFDPDETPELCELFDELVVPLIRNCGDRV